MHLLHRSSDNNNTRALRRVGSPQTKLMMSKSESIKKRGGKKGGGVKHGSSKRARLRAGLAAALQELRLAGRGKRGGEGSLSSVTATRPGLRADGPSGGSRSDVAATPAERAAAGPEAPAAIGGGVITGGAVLPLLLLVVALACVVGLGRAPAVCCCTCAAWWCRGSSVESGSSAAANYDRKPALVLAARQRW